jgi:glycopeptide antibiotics resistance protein
VRAHLVPAVLLVAYLACLAVVLVQPVPTIASGVVEEVEELLRTLGAPSSATAQGRVELVLNAAMCVPVGALAVAAFPRVPWASWVGYGFALASLVELTQAVLLPARSAQAVDVVANTVGVLVGAATAAGVQRLRGSQERRGSNAEAPLPDVPHRVDRT